MFSLNDIYPIIEKQVALNEKICPGWQRQAKADFVAEASALSHMLRLHYLDRRAGVYECDRYPELLTLLVRACINHFLVMNEGHAGAAALSFMASCDVQEEITYAGLQFSIADQDDAGVFDLLCCLLDDDQISVRVIAEVMARLNIDSWTMKAWSEMALACDIGKTNVLKDAEMPLIHSTIPAGFMGKRRIQEICQNDDTAFRLDIAV